MKNLVFSMLAMAAMVSCTSESNPIDEVDNGQPKEIKLNAGVVTTKAAIESGENSLPTTALPDVHFFRLDGDNPIWTSAAKYFSGTIETNGDITPSAIQYYPTTGENTAIAGLFLGENKKSEPTVTTGNVEFTITGSEDILWAQPQNLGNRNTQTSNKLPFQHKLTQFKFVVKTDNASITSALTGIDIKFQNVNTKSSISLANGTLSTWSEANNEIGVTGLTAPAAGVVSSATAGIMLEPNLASINLLVKADTFPTDGILVKIEGSDSNKFEQGKAYIITLTFQAKTVSAKATIAKWDDGTATGGTVE